MKHLTIFTRNILLLFCLLETACDKISLPNSDSTPPVLIWNVFNENTNKGADHPGNPTIQAKRGEKYRITLKAVDKDGGIKFIKINPSIGGGEMSWTCTLNSGGENVGQNKDALLGSLTQNLSPDSDGKVLTSIFLIQNLDFKMDCQDNTWNFSGGSAFLSGQASNYFNGVTNSKIKFTVTP